MSLQRILFVALVAFLAVTSVQSFDLDDLLYEACESNANVPFTSYVNFRQQNADGTQGNYLSARLKVPKTNGTLPSTKLPAVVVVHGSAGLDSRGELYSYNLNQIGIATLEVDLWAARGWFGGVTGRPNAVSLTIPDAFGALYFLAQNVSAIDPTRIGIMGFSWGGVVSMLTATTDYSNAYKFKFAAHNPHYPICWGYNHVPGYPFKTTTGKKVFIQTGDLDDYDTPTSCSSLISSLSPAVQSTIDLTIYKKSTHGFDRLEPAMVVTDVFSHQGKGGLVQFTPNPLTTAKSVKDTLKFWRQQLRP